MMDSMSLFTLALTLFLIMNPLGNMKHFLSLLRELKAPRHRFVVAREMVFALIIMFIFSLLGERIAWAFSFDETTIYLASGAILFLAAIKIIFPKEEHIPHIHGEEPFLIPIAIPIIASPALLATIMLYSQSEILVWPMVLSIFIAWTLSIVLLLGSRRILRLIGPNGLIAIERIMGIVLVLLAVQRFMEGILLFVAHK